MKAKLRDLILRNNLVTLAILFQERLVIRLMSTTKWEPPCATFGKMKIHQRNYLTRLFVQGRSKLLPWIILLNA